ncbi:MAG: metallophosphatase [Prolixibacteraceae bacterium]|nr:metallophosphatase [Prolixibacteraceae bacterium]
MQKPTGGFTMLNRRAFIRNTLIAGAGLYALPSLAQNNVDKLTILHTNDLHCHFEPFPENDPKYPGQGGMNRISAYVKQVRQLNPDMLLLDSGDFSQGTPYYNFYNGEVVLKLMSEMGYDASTFGNHEFDSGLESFNNVMQYADFPLVSANYDFSKTPLKGRVKKHIVIEKKGIRIGIYGLGIELQGLVGKNVRGNTVYKEPLEVALDTEDYLRYEEKCDFVICLSHLGFQYDSPQICDVQLAQKTYETDLILGGHTHTFLDSPVEYTNKNKRPVVVNQVGWAALMLGQLEFFFEQKKKTHIDLTPNKRVG